MPAISPVVTLKILLLSRLKNACVSPSMYVDSIKASVHQILSVKTLNINRGKEIYPMCIPVHLAQTGNCFPFQKKDRSGFLWQNVI
jgi:hypothetical protein